MSSLIIIGMKHSGKTTLGQGVADILKLPFFDTDKLIEEQTGLPVRELYNTKGVDAFKKAELEACTYLKEKFHHFQSLIISTGGGISDNPQAVEVLKSLGKFIYLDMDEKTCLSRILKKSKKSGSLPAYIAKENPQNPEEIENIFHKFYLKRSASYKEIADFTFAPKPEAQKEENINLFFSFVDKNFYN